jgi:hypothetical protein
MAWILAVALVNRPGPSLMALLTVVGGIPAYWYTVRRKPVGQVAGPVHNR